MSEWVNEEKKYIGSWLMAHSKKNSLICLIGLISLVSLLGRKVKRSKETVMGKRSEVIGKERYGLPAASSRLPGKR